MSDMQEDNIIRVVKIDGLVMTVNKLLLLRLGPRRSNYIK